MGLCYGVEVMTRALVSVFSLFVLLVCAWPAAAQSLRVDQVRVGAHPDKTRLVIDLSQSADFRTFILDDPHRLVVDLPSFEWRVSGAVQSDLIAGARTGRLQAGIDRLVFDLKAPVKVMSAFLLPRNDGLPDRLVIDVVRASAAEALASKDKIHGTLDTAAPSFLSTGDRTAGSVPAPARKPSGAVVKPLIVLDPGHGGQDPGAVSRNNTYEKNITLAVARELKKQLEASGKYRVQLTRDKDVFIKLADRVRIAQRAKADLFISIHADSIDKGDVSGASVYTLSNTASDAQTARLAARENKADAIGGVDLSHEDKDVANILINLAMRDTMNQSKFFANTLVSSMNNGGIRMLQNPHRFAGFAVLKAPEIPSVLVEVGFMSNNREAAALSSESYRRTVAAALKSGIDGYFARVQKNNKN